MPTQDDRTGVVGRVDGDPPARVPDGDGCSVGFGGPTGVEVVVDQEPASARVELAKRLPSNLSSNPKLRASVADWVAAVAQSLGVRSPLAAFSP